MKTLAAIACVALLMGCATRDWDKETPRHAATMPATAQATEAAPAPQVRLIQHGDATELDIDSIVGNPVLVDGHRRYLNGYTRYPNGVLRWIVVTDKHDNTTSLAPEAIAELCEPQSNQRFEYNPVLLGFTDPPSASAARKQVRAEQARLAAEAENARRLQQSEGEQYLAQVREENARRRRWDFEQREQSRGTSVVFDTPTDNGAAASAAFKIVVALGAEVARRQSDQDQGLGAAIVGQLLGMGRDAAIESAITDAFPDLSEHQASIIASVVGLMFEGRLTKLDVATEVGKQEVIRALDEQDPALGGSAKIVDFLVSVGMKLHDQGGS